MRKSCPVSPRKRGIFWAVLTIALVMMLVAYAAWIEGGQAQTAFKVPRLVQPGASHGRYG